MLSDNLCNDFIVSELLAELKAENGRKDKRIRILHKTVAAVIVAAFVAVLLVVVSFLWCLNQYDFTVTESEPITAEGVRTIFDSASNVIDSGFTSTQPTLYNDNNH